VSRYPLTGYGTIAFGFGEDIEYHARAVNTYIGNRSDIWLGFDRAVVPDPQTARQGDLFRKNLRDRILNQPQIQSLSPAQKSFLEIGLAHILENNLDIVRVGPNKWEAIFMDEGKEMRGADIISSLADSLFVVSDISIIEAYKEALTSICQPLEHNFGTIEQGEGQPPLRERYEESRDAHMRALIVFDDEPVLQSRNAKTVENYVEITRRFPTKDAVQQKCEELGIRVPIIPWTVAEICSDYDVLFGLRQFGKKPLESAGEPISESRKFH